MSQIKIKEHHFGYFTVSESKSNVRGIPQPFKISQLLGLPQNEKNSSIKISLPERLTPYLKSSRKKNANVYTELPYGERKVRRNLDFTETQTAIETKSFIRTDNIIEKFPKEKIKSCWSRKSFLLPPNTVKDLHIKSVMKQKKPILTHSNGKMNSESKYLSIVKKSRNHLTSVRNSNAHTNSIICRKNNETSVIQHTSSRMFTVNDQSGINILYSSNLDLTDANDTTVKKGIAENLMSDGSLDINVPNIEKSSHKIATKRSDLSSTCIMSTKKSTDLECNAYQNIYHNIDEYSLATCMLRDKEKIHDATNTIEEKCLATNTKMTRKHTNENLCLSLQVVKAINESYVNSQYNTDDSEYVTLNKTKFIDLTSKLKLFICKLEEDLSNLKLTLATITNEFSATDMTNKVTEVNETKKKQEMDDHLNNGARAMTNTNNKSSSCVTINDTQEDDKEACKTHIDLLETAICKESNAKTRSLHEIDSENNKENKEMEDSAKHSKSDTRRRSVRLMAKALNNLDITNDSFVNLENELSNTTPHKTTTLFENTHVTDKCKGRKGEKPLKEYMALKSRMSCLLTPNIRRLNSMEPDSNTHSESDNGKASLSNKILVELNNLYADSPDT